MARGTQQVRRHRGYAARAGMIALMRLRMVELRYGMPHPRPMAARLLLQQRRVWRGRGRRRGVGRRRNLGWWMGRRVQCSLLELDAIWTAVYGCRRGRRRRARHGCFALLSFPARRVALQHLDHPRAGSASMESMQEQQGAG